MSHDRVIVTSPAPVIVQVKSGGAGSGANRLSELLDVNVTGVQNGHILIYSSSVSKWVVGAQVDPNRLNSAFTHANSAYDTANGAFTQSNLALSIANSAALRANSLVTDNVPETTTNLYFTSARVRANIGNTTPINYNSTTGVISHADSGVTPTTYGNASFIPQVTVDSRGHVIGVVNVTIDQSFTQGAYAHANGAFAQANIARTNADAAFANANTAIYTATQIRANISNAAPITYSSTTGVIGHADSGVTATTYGNTLFVSQVTVDPRGHITGVTNVAIDQSLAQTARDHANGAFAQANGATTNVNAAFTHANAAYAQANVANTIAASAALRANSLVTDNVPETTTNLYFTSARVRANISNTAPITYNSTTGVIGHAVSGVTAQTYGNNTLIPQITVDTHGHVTAITNVSITGLPAATVNGQLLIGNTVSSSFDVNTLTQGSGILITNDKGSITIAATGGSALDQFARDHANGAFDKANSAGLRANTLVTDNVPETTTNLYFTAARVRANIGNTTPINYNPATGVISHADSGVTTTTYGNATFVSQVTVDSRGHVTSAANVLIDQSFAQGAYAHANGAFAQANIATTNADAAFANANTAIYTATQIRANIGNSYPVYYNAGTGVISFVPATANGQLLIGNTVSGTFDVTTLTPGSGIAIANDKGSITISATGGSALDQFARDTANGAYAHANGAFAHANAAYTQANTATTNADAAFAQANIARTNADAAFANANTAIYTAAQIRANVSNNYPVYYNAGTGVISFVPATANGQLLIGNTVSGTFDVATLTPGSGIVIANDKGSITISATGGSALDQFARDTANGAFTQANLANTIATSAALRANTLVTDNVPETTTNLYFTAARVRANISNTAPINYNSTTGVLSHALSGVTATTYGNASHVSQITIDQFGHGTTITNTPISISASQITSGVLSISHGGTGQTSITVNGSLLIGNTVSGGYDVNALTQGSGIIITNDKGTITIAASGGGGGGASNVFSSVNVATENQSNLNAVGTTTLIIAPGTGIDITTTPAANTLTIYHNLGHGLVMASGHALYT